MSQPYTRRDTFLNRTVGRYRLVEKIGAGGMGSVYKGVHTEIPDLVVAIKLLAQSCVDNDALRQRFRDEASICARLGDRSPNIVQIRDYGILDELDLPYYAMEYLQGRGLEEVIQLDTQLPLEQAVSLVQQLCEGLNVAHEQGVIHRDLKPSNIYLIPDAQRGERVKILDFGIAKFLRDAALAQTTGPLTQGYMGTPRYSSPEQLQGKEIDLRSDLYSLGLILYELFAGSQPFAVEDDSFVSWYRAHNELTPRPMAEANPKRSVPADIEQVILQCLAKNPQDRPHNSLEISQQLERAVRRLREDSRRQEDQQVLDRALQLTTQGRWNEASSLVQSISYDSPLYAEAQTCLKNWQLEAEYQRVFEQARLMAQEGEISSLVRAVSTVGTIPSNSVVYRTAHVESQRWIERVLESAEDLARTEKWSEALQRAELISTLPGVSQRLSPLIPQWRKEQQAADVLRRAESLAAERRWEQAVKQLESIPAGTVSQSRALQRRPLWQKEIQAKQALEQAEKLAAEKKYDEAISRAATLVSGTVFDAEAQNKQAVWKAELAQQRAQTYLDLQEDHTPTVTSSTSSSLDRTEYQPSSPETFTKPQPPLGLWIGGGLAALAAVAAVFILNAPKPVSTPEPNTPPGRPTKTIPPQETLGQKFLERAQTAAQEKRWGDCLQQINQLQGLTIPQTIEGPLRSLGNQCSAGQFAIAQSYIAQQQWKESYESLKRLLTLAPKSSEAAQAQQLLQKVSDNWTDQLLQGAIKNANDGELFGDRTLLLQAIATASQVPGEAKRYPRAQELMKEWKNALKLIPESSGSPNASKS